MHEGACIHLRMCASVCTCTLKCLLRKFVMRSLCHTQICTRSVELMPHTHMCTRVVIVEGPQDLQNMHKHTEHSDLNSHRHNLCNLIICGDNSTFHPETRQSYFWQRGIIDMQPNIPQTLTHTSAYFGKRE